MSLDKKLLLEIIEAQKTQRLDLNLIIDGKSFSLKNPLIKKSSTPLSRPKKREGMYFSDTRVFKIIATTNDRSLVPLLSKSMLGPSMEFQELEIKTKLKIDNQTKDILFFTNLTNFMQNSSQLELNMIIVRIRVS